MAHIRPLILGWEFPPNSVGGLSTHTYELTKALTKLGVKVKVVLPFKEHIDMDEVDFELIPIDSLPDVYTLSSRDETFDANLYNNLFERINRYVYNTVKLTSGAEYDVIHANDWLTARAGLELKKLTGKPLIVTIHSTEFGRTAGNPWNMKNL